MAFRKIALTSLAVFALGSAGQSLAQDPGLLLTNGNVLTLDEDNTVVNSVFVRLGRIAEVGNDLEAPEGAEVIDLEGRTMIPGLMDSHAHFLRHGQRPGYDVRAVEQARSIADFQAALSAKAEEVPEGALVTVVTGWNPIQLAENRMPTMAELDEALPNHPAYIHYAAYGPAVTNTKGKEMFEAALIPVAEDGVFEERDEAVQSYYYLRGEQTIPQKARATRDLMGYLNSVGMTSVIDGAGTPFDGAQIYESEYDYDPILAVWRAGEMTMRVRIMFMTWDEEIGDGTGQSLFEQRVRNSFMGFGDDMLRISGFGEHSTLTATSDAMYNSAAIAARRGWTMQEHSNTREDHYHQVEVYEAANEIAPIADLRWQLTHVHEIDQEVLDRLIALGAGVTVQNQKFFATEGGSPPYRMIVDSGIPVGGGTDSTVRHPINPWFSIYYMVTGKNVLGDAINADQAITRLEALKLYTIGSAWFSHDDDDIGTIETGKLADFAVLSDNPLTVMEDELLNVTSDLTIVGGNVVHANPDFYRP
ncbi:MAG: amidohydrolase [Gammaproteobacteria bacterium]